jgi:predicted metal-dependent peptidase
MRDLQKYLATFIETNIIPLCPGLYNYLYYLPIRYSESHPEIISNDGITIKVGPPFYELDNNDKVYYLLTHIYHIICLHNHQKQLIIEEHHKVLFDKIAQLYNDYIITNNSNYNLKTPVSATHYKAIKALNKLPHPLLSYTIQELMKIVEDENTVSDNRVIESMGEVMEETGSYVDESTPLDVREFANSSLLEMEQNRREMLENLGNSLFAGVQGADDILKALYRESNKKINWRNKLRGCLVPILQREFKVPTHKKISKRTRINPNIFYPGYTYPLNYNLNMIYVLDTSGSMNMERDIAPAFGEIDYLKAIFKINVLLICVDAEVQAVYEIPNNTSMKDYLKKIAIKGGGGTDFSPVFPFLEQPEYKKKVEKNILIIHTDGYPCHWPSQVELSPFNKVVYLVTTSMVTPTLYGNTEHIYLEVNDGR